MKDLISQANAIIEQKGHTRQDMKYLAKIKRQLSKLYDQFITLAGDQEALYNKTRTQKYVDYKKETKKDQTKSYTEGEYQTMSKFYAECKFGEFRVNKEKARGMKAQIDAIDTFLIAIYKFNEAEGEALSSNVEN